MLIRAEASDSALLEPLEAATSLGKHTSIPASEVPTERPLGCAPKLRLVTAASGSLSRSPAQSSHSRHLAANSCMAPSRVSAIPALGPRSAGEIWKPVIDHEPLQTPFIPSRARRSRTRKPSPGHAHTA